MNEEKEKEKEEMEERGGGGRVGRNGLKEIIERRSRSRYTSGEKKEKCKEVAWERWVGVEQKRGADEGMGWDGRCQH